jgi:transposase
VDTSSLRRKESTMPRTRPPYPPEIRRQMVELVRVGRSPEELAEEFEPSAQTIRNWLVQADRDEGLRHDGLTSEEREELRRLRRENKQLRLEREILSRAAAWWTRRFPSVTARETGTIPPNSSGS